LEALGLNDDPDDGILGVGEEDAPDVAAEAVFDIGVARELEVVADAEAEPDIDAAMELEVALDAEVEVGVKGAGVELCIEVVATEEV